MDPETGTIGWTKSADELERELTDAEIKLAHAHSLMALGQLVAGVVHEINNPIGSIVSNNEVVIRSVDTLRKLLAENRDTGRPAPQKAFELLDMLANLAGVDKIACDRISTIVKSLKTLSRKEEAPAQYISLNDLLRDTLKLVECQFKRRIRLETDLAPLPQVECIPNLLGQVFLNLLVNGAQAIKEDGTIRVTSRLSGDAVEVAISDSGAGILPEHRDRIFRTGFTTKPVGVGTGLGLSLSKQIVEQRHGGRMWFESAPGHGTTFYVRIPVEMATQPEKSESSQ